MRPILSRRFWLRFASLALGTLSLLAPTAVSAHARGKVLIVLSSQDHLTVFKDGTRKEATDNAHPTGFFLSELMVPLRALIDAGYSPVFANPLGNEAVMDAVSDSAQWFGNDDKAYKEARTLCENIGICSPGSLIGKAKLFSLAQIRSGGLDVFAGVFLPGGHAPMEDLWKDPNLGAILRDFHAKKKPTALICHAPIALLSTLANPQAFGTTLQKGDVAGAEKLARGWIYRGYTMTVFSTKEEQQEEPGGRNVLKGYVRFYPDEALDHAGGKVLVRGVAWRNNVIQTGELITGENPFSDHVLATTLVNALRAWQAGHRR